MTCHYVHDVMKQENIRVSKADIFSHLLARRAMAERFALSCTVADPFSYRRKYPGQSVVCHVRVRTPGVLRPVSRGGKYDVK